MGWDEGVKVTFNVYSYLYIVFISTMRIWVLGNILNLKKQNVSKLLRHSLRLGARVAEGCRFCRIADVKDLCCFLL